MFMFHKESNVISHIFKGITQKKFNIGVKSANVVLSSRNPACQHTEIFQNFKTVPQSTSSRLIQYHSERTETISIVLFNQTKNLLFQNKGLPSHFPNEGDTFNILLSVTESLQNMNDILVKQQKVMQILFYLFTNTFLIC